MDASRSLIELSISRNISTCTYFEGLFTWELRIERGLPTCLTPESRKTISTRTYHVKLFIPSIQEPPFLQVTLRQSSISEVKEEKVIGLFRFCFCFFVVVVVVCFFFCFCFFFLKLLRQCLAALV